MVNDRADSTLIELSELVSFDTTNDAGISDCQTHIVSRLTPYANVVEIFNVGDSVNSNIIAHFGEKRTGGVMFAGHIDVVPVKNQPWSANPFTTRINAGKIYGRGTTDMKGFIACLINSAQVFSDNADMCPVTICLTPDEETDFIGATELPRQLSEMGIKPQGAIVGEPTEMHIGVSHPGFSDMQSHFRGKSAHSSLQELGANAIEAAAEFIIELNRLNKDVKSMGSNISVGKIDGGIARNIVPDNCIVD